MRIACIWGWLNCVSLRSFWLQMWSEYPSFYSLSYAAVKNVFLIAAVMVWSFETCCDWFTFQLFRIHFSGCDDVVRARVSTLQLENNSNEAVRSVACLLPSVPTLHSRISLRATKFGLQEMVEFRSMDYTGFNPQLYSSIWYFLMLQFLHELTLARCFKSWPQCAWMTYRTWQQFCAFQGFRLSKPLLSPLDASEKCANIFHFRGNLGTLTSFPLPRRVLSRAECC